ncbi:XPG I-region family protein [Trichomonas vaginalis G3]|uniref:XPG I-region family protein n=1 Tax=Trichomonas vaginalis (strain ATCC PRA-98 / G3) TaxID=412133 RepID=A2EAN6_TRIV3|nr:nucleotide-excision repair, DNA incision, 3'-to lesion [Trichomonas vaginalis G3]EAY10239.1 XPG I-region family protein [Trichomonas vaginalis G3]KAI5487721.1 nucleotide-excision repair, DNA incision, 3'-to lesion [Trichomonas vaginalis G3]|eukprot:XP_001322462.1 XPG I-region family protein [Trichomonas vaginalis G3]
MGVPGLWRILDTASQPVSLDYYSGSRIALDINSHLNRMLHGNHGGNWLFYLMKDLFTIMHHNISIIVVFQGSSSNKKMFSRLLDQDETRLRSILIRTANSIPQEPPKPNPPQRTEEQEKIATKTLEEIQNKSPKKRREILRESDPLQYSLSQLNFVKTLPAPAKKPMTVHRSEITTPYIFKPQDDTPEIKEPVPKDVVAPSPKPKSEQFTTDFINEYKELLNSVDENPEENSEEKNNEKIPNDDKDDFEPISLLPADNPYLPPVENYVTADHIRAVKGLLDVMDVPYIIAPEESTAECARLELEGIVDATASDDNNAFLFGSKILIRNIFLRPHSITLKSLEVYGMTRKRLLQLAMMIDGDYNDDIKKRLFTVGPIRGLKILSLFPDEKNGLFQFKEWFSHVIQKNQSQYNNGNPNLIKFSQSKWVKKLIVPSNFPPADLMEAFISPVVSDEKPVAHSPLFDRNNLIEYVQKNSNALLHLITNYVDAFIGRNTRSENSFVFTKFTVNPVNIPESVFPYFDFFKEYLQGNKEIQNKTVNFLSDESESEKETENEKENKETEILPENSNFADEIPKEVKIRIRRESAIRRREEKKDNSMEPSSDDTLRPPSYYAPTEYLMSSSSTSSQTMSDAENESQKKDEGDYSDFEEVQT